MNEHTCLVCGYSGDPTFYPRDYNICDCCGTEFGYDDRVLTHRQLREQWRAAGYPWFYAAAGPPENWDPEEQLALAGFGLFIKIKFASHRYVTSYGVAANVAA